MYSQARQHHTAQSSWINDDGGTDKVSNSSLVGSFAASILKIILEEHWAVTEDGYILGEYKQINSPVLKAKKGIGLGPKNRNTT